jgi:hypothetical protein
MPHGTEHHLEEAEHAEHHSRDNFTRDVAMTMAIVAAALACITMLSHRSHNETISKQIEANDHITEASNQWGYFQAKKNRAYMADALAKVVESRPGESSAPKRSSASVVTEFQGLARKWEQDTKEIEEKARELQERAKDLQAEAHHAHLHSNRFDLGELGVEMALVLCSLAVLTRRAPFWHAGMGIGALGFAVAMSAFL